MNDKKVLQIWGKIQKLKEQGWNVTYLEGLGGKEIMVWADSKSRTYSVTFVNA